MTGEAENPYATPASEATTAVFEVPELHGRTPWSFWLAITSCALLAICEAHALLFEPDQGYFFVDLAVLAVCLVLALGLLCRSRLAMRASRLFAIAIGVPLTCAVVFVAVVAFAPAFKGDPPGAEARELVYSTEFSVLVLFCLALWTLFMSLGRLAARVHLRLLCTRCRSRRVGAANFLYTKAKCKECGAVW